MTSFKKQIEEDIREYQQIMPHLGNIQKDEWAFNYWVLDKLFYEDEDLIEGKITDYKDMCIDAYQIYEETKEVYLIQNKYYSSDTLITSEYIKTDFLLKGITALEKGIYKRSEELQNFFTKYKKHQDFTVHLQLFVTNNQRSKESEEYIKKYNLENPNYRAKIYYLDDIKERYYGEIKEIRKSISVEVESVNKGTILNINTEDYKLENVLDAKYVLTPVVSVYRLYRNSIEKGYPIFDKNIREYLGNRGVNKSIYKTLLDKEDRKNFFYYNNGITVICDSISKATTKPSTQKAHNMNVSITIENPQIVNGCQTVNSIYEALENEDPENIEREYKDTFVMLKILEIDKNDKGKEKLYKDIVKFNNSQNAIDEKTFVANTEIFIRLQLEFEEKGFLLLIKQSDKNKFSQKYETISKLRQANDERLQRFGLNTMKRPNDVFIPLEKLLQVINAFVDGGYVAYVKKSNMLKFGTDQYNKAGEFIKLDEVTNDTLIELYLLYKRAEQEKKLSDEQRSPIPYYLIDGFAKYECKNRNASLIIESLNSKEKIDRIIRLYKGVSGAYSVSYSRRHKIDYNKMIKRPIDYDIFDDSRATSLATM